MKLIVCELLLLVSTVIRSRHTAAKLWHCDINLLCIREQPYAHILAPETIFFGRGSHAAGRGGGVPLLLSRWGP